MWSGTLGWDLASTGAVENNPHNQVIAEGFESMLGSGGHEQKVAWLEWVPLAIVKQNPSAANDNVNLVLCVRRLLIRTGGRREFYFEGAAPQKADRALALGARNAHLTFRETDHAAAFRIGHASLLVLPDTLAPSRRAQAPE
jgi:hypothetical protein